MIKIHLTEHSGLVRCIFACDNNVEIGKNTS